MRRVLVTLVLASLGACIGSAPAWANTATPYCTTATQTIPAPCQDGWYVTTVRLTWNVNPPSTTSTSPGCDSAMTYSGDTNAVAECDVAWPGSSQPIPFGYQIRVEISPPTATATPARPPDSNGWYNRPVLISYAGIAFSGISSCTPSKTYDGPSAINAAVTGSCVDNAGKTAPASVTLNYDDVPPTVTGATPSRPPDAKGGFYTHPVTFRFSGTDAVSGIASCDTVTYDGPASGSVVGGCHDRAGNYASVAVPVRYRASAPRASITRARSSLVLRWRALPRASYYNIQLYRGGKKVLSAWPAQASLLLRPSWSFAGHRFRLKPGRYRWYVWPGYGSRAAARYGRIIVSATFRVSKRR